MLAFAGVTGAQQFIDSSQHSLPASQGILHDVFAALKEKVATIGLDYDASSANIIGQPTVLPSNISTNDPLANHALVFMLARLTSRWKKAFDWEVKNGLFDVIKHSEAVGITVSAAVTDMGPGNVAIW
ncbi:uncharacterized protein LOC142783781 [Rhipicephalus microplus]|uniref:uncharacterized protein LOC142783781 n=1 Tax=Rhipicephalus microplus TaxID=6941 RepID=UPI003F6B72FB